MEENNTKASIYIPVPRDMLNDLKRVIPYGIRTLLYQIITNDLIKYLDDDEDGKKLAALLGKRKGIEDIIKGNKE